MADERTKAVIEHYVDRISETEKDIAIIQRENEIQTRVFVKFEETVEKLQDLTESMHRLLSIHDERIRVQEKTTDDIKQEMENEIKELENRLTTKLSESENRIMLKLNELQSSWKEESNEKKKEKSAVDGIKRKLQDYKWFVMGGILVAGVFLGKTGMISNIISAIYYMM